MPHVTIAFGNHPAAKLAGIGCKMPKFTGSHDLDARSFFEPPMALLATVPTPTLIQVGAFTSISGGKISNVKIGRYSAIAPEVIIGAHEHPIDWLTTSRIPYVPALHDWHRFCRPDRAEFVEANRKRFTKSSPVTTVGDDVWIGQGAFIKSGVTLGTGCVVAARSVVVKDVPPYAVVAGTPATVKKYRFDEKLIERLLALRWWRFCLYDCFQMPFDRPEEALDQLEELIAGGTIAEYAPEKVTAERLRALFADGPAQAAA
jgi:acetyltransferase-like isoleucine patch superfamily enzyme